MPGGNPSRVARTIVEVDLTDPGEVIRERLAGPHLSCLVRVLDLPVARLELDAPAGNPTLEDLLQAMDRPRIRAATTSALTRRLLELLPGVGGPSLEGLLTAHAAAAPGAEGWPSLSIVVCTRDRPASLERTLAALEGTRAPAVTVTVVDNAPSDDRTERLVHERFAWVRYERQAAPGLSRARNHALASTNGDVVAFVDDDVVVGSSWAAALRRTFHESPEAMVVTGLVEPWSLEGEAERWFEAYGGFGRGYGRRWVVAPGAGTRPIARTHGNVGTLGTGANLAVRREWAVGIGGFDPDLGAGTPTAGGDDLEFLFRTLKAGGLLVYEPAAVVRHVHRPGFDGLLAQIESWGTGMRAYLARTSRAYPEERRAAISLHLWLLAAWTVRRVAWSLVRAGVPTAVHFRELRGSVRGGAIYRASRSGGPLAAPRAPAETPPAPPTDFTVDLGEPLSHLRAATAARVRVRWGGRELGVVTIAAVGGVIGVARLRDAIATRLGPSGAPGGISARALLELVRRGGAATAAPGARSAGRSSETAR
jgi:GT2 family glycosyltransferase